VGHRRAGRWAPVARPLGDRTREVALALLDGASDREIAAEVGVSERTVPAEVHRVVQWLGADDALLAERGDGVGDGTRRSIWHKTHLPTWSEVRAARGLFARRHRSVDDRYVTSVRSLTRLPMLSSHHHPYLRVGPVVAPMLLVDHALLYVGAPLGHELEGQVWSSSNGHVLREAVRCFRTVWDAGRAVVAPGDEPPFTRRMVDIGFLLSDGASDKETTRSLQVSGRTVSAEVAEIIHRLGARSRTHAIALVAAGGPY
jgi:DNA-binding NarL/FixJ family response regulator